MPDADDLINALDALDKKIKENKRLTVKALGLLLLGRNIEDEELKDKTRDPTDFILNDPSLTLPDR